MVIYQLMSKVESNEQPLASKITRRRLLTASVIGGGIGLGVVVPTVRYLYGTLEAKPQAQTLSQAIEKSSWDNLKNTEALGRLTELAAQTYVEATHSPRLDVAALTTNTFFYTTRQRFLDHGAKLNPDIDRSYQAIEYADFDTKQVLIDLSKLASVNPNFSAGGTVFGKILTQWLAVDLQERTGLRGGFLDPRVVGKTTFRGLSPIIDNQYAYPRLDSVMRESIGVMIQLDSRLREISPNSTFVSNGTVDLVKHCSVSKIRVIDLYNLYSTSDAQGLARLLGSNLLPEGDAVQKGLGLFQAIEQDDPIAFEQTGIYRRFPKAKA